MSVVDSPNPQDENTYPAMQRADCWLMSEQRYRCFPMLSLSADKLNKISAPCNASEELGGIADQRSSHISMANLTFDVSKIRLEPMEIVCPQSRTLSSLS